MMIIKSIKEEEDVLAFLKAVKSLTEEHQIFPLTGMIDDFDRVIRSSETAILNSKKWKEE